MQCLKLDDITVDKIWHYDGDDPDGGRFIYDITIERDDNLTTFRLDRGEILDLYDTLTILMAKDFSRTVTLP